MWGVTVWVRVCGVGRDACVHVRAWQGDVINACCGCVCCRFDALCQYYLSMNASQLGEMSDLGSAFKLLLKEPLERAGIKDKVRMHMHIAAG